MIIEPSDAKGIDFYGNRSKEQYIFRRVTYPGFEEKEDYENIQGGSIERSALSSLKVSGSLDFSGDIVPNDHDMVRIYYRFEDAFLDTATECLATMFFSIADPTHTGSLVEGTMDCTSTLVLLQRKSYGLPFTVPAGTNAVAKAAELIRSFNLPVSYSGASTYTLRSDHTFEPGDNFLEIVNWLLNAASYASATVDAYGTVILEPYQEPTERETRYTFRDDERSIMLPEVKTSNNYQDTPNVVRLRYTTEEETIWAAASNIDPDSKASTVSRGYENTLEEEVSELAGDTRAQRIANLKAMALQQLIDNSSEIEKVEMGIAWLPIDPNDAIEVDYRMAGILWRGAITNVQIDLETSIPCQLSLRNFVRRDLKTLVEGGAF